MDPGRARQGSLDLLATLQNQVPSHDIAREIDAMLAMDLTRDVLGEGLVEVRPPEARVARHRVGLEYAALLAKDGDIERPASEVEDEELSFAGELVEALGDRAGAGFGDHPDDLEVGQLGRPAGRPGDGLGHAGGDRHHHLADRTGESAFGELLEVAVHGRDQLDGRVFLPAGDDQDAAAGPFFHLNRVLSFEDPHFGIPVGPTDDALQAPDDPMGFGQAPSRGGGSDDNRPFFGQIDHARNAWVAALVDREVQPFLDPCRCTRERSPVVYPYDELVVGHLFCTCRRPRSPPEGGSVVCAGLSRGHGAGVSKTSGGGF